jgi:hypothetical protein
VLWSDSRVSVLKQSQAFIHLRLCLREGCNRGGRILFGLHKIRSLHDLLYRGTRLSAILVFLVSIWPIQADSATPKLVKSGETNRTTVEISDEIIDGDAQVVSRFFSGLNLDGHTVEIILSGRGGNLQEGINIGRYIWQQGYRTIVKDNSECVDACALAFLGGHDKSYGGPYRRLGSNSGLGICPCSIMSFLRDNLLAFIELFRYVAEVVVGDEFLTLILKCPPNQIRYLTNEEAKKFNIDVNEPCSGLFDCLFKNVIGGQAPQPRSN